MVSKIKSPYCVEITNVNILINHLSFDFAKYVYFYKNGLMLYTLFVTSLFT